MDEPITKIISNQLDIKLELFMQKGLNLVLRKIENRKAASLDKIPPEIWKTREFDNILLQYYNQQHSYINKDENRASGGVSILIRKDIPQHQINIDTEFQAVAVKTTLHKPINICSIYIPPHDPINKTKLYKLIEQISRPPPIARCP